MTSRVDMIFRRRDMLSANESRHTHKQVSAQFLLGYLTSLLRKTSRA